MAILLDCLPLTVGWLLTWQAASLYHLYIARTITGLGIGAGVPIASIYLREISTPELRGTLTILMPAAANTGNLLMYILGWLLSWRLTCLPGALLPLLPPLLLVFLPETPAWLLARGRRQEARENLSKLRGVGGEEVEEELQSLESVVQAETDNQSGSWKESLARLVDRTVLLPMALLVFLFFTQSFSGSNMVSYYTVTILQMAEIPLDENLTAILVAAQYVFGYSLSSIMVTRIPRRLLLMGSLALMMTANLAAGLVLLDKHKSNNNNNNNTESEEGQQQHLTIVDADNLLGLDSSSELEEDTTRSSIVSLIPVFSCIFITFGYACGLGPVPFILFGELFPSMFCYVSAAVIENPLTLQALSEAMPPQSQHSSDPLPYFFQSR